LLASDGARTESFGYSVSLDGDTALIGAYNNRDNGISSGSAYVFTYDGNNWIEQTNLLPSDGDNHDEFGFSVSMCGDRAIIGAWRDEDKGEYSGSAYVFTHNSTSWTEQTKLLASDGEGWDHFGISVSIDGIYAFVGATGDDNDGSAGSVYVFIENEKPKMPTISGPTKLKPRIDYNYNFTNCFDPEGDNITYYIEWGDGSVDEGFVNSSGAFDISHNWTWKGDFLIRAKLIDDYGLESDWAILEISVPRNRLLTITFLMRFFERFPNAFPFLRHIIGL
jgi:hypothetical protein